jgi:aspartyl-tRNA synthetase
VDIEGVVTVPEQKIEATTQQVEIQVESLFAVSLAEPQLPMQIEDASRPNTVFKEQVTLFTFVVNVIL